MSTEGMEEAGRRIETARQKGSTELNLSNLGLTELPEAIGNLTKLTTLDLEGNNLTSLPDFIGNLTNLRGLFLNNNNLTELPEAIGSLTNLNWLRLDFNSLKNLPRAFTDLTKLAGLALNDNKFPPDLQAACFEGIPALFSYLKSRAREQFQVSEVKLILVGEGAVGKSCLLDAIAGQPWKEYDSTHGIRIESFPATHPESGESIHFNGWDFGGQKVYKPTHQLFFSSPAVYLVVWKPREGSEQSRVEEWIALVKLREPGARIFVVATHGGPLDRQPDIDRQEIFDKFGRETVLDFFHVESKPDEESGERRGIEALKCAILREASRILDESGRGLPAEWQRAWEALLATQKPYVSMDEVCKACDAQNMDAAASEAFINIWHRRGRLVHYSNDPLLESIVILRPDWLAQAMSYVLDDDFTRKQFGLITKARLKDLWDDPKNDKKFHYEEALHEIFIKLLARYDLAYPVTLPLAQSDGEETFLIAQLVDDIRPEEKLAAAWPADIPEGFQEKRQVCRIFPRDPRTHAGAEGIFYQIVVRQHRHSLGRTDFNRSVHWKRGLVIEDSYNGRARLEHIDNDVHITVRAADPHRFLTKLTEDVRYLVEDFWPGLECQIATPCIAPCGGSVPGMALFSIKTLLDSKARGRDIQPCPICNDDQFIDSLLANTWSSKKSASLARIDDVEEVKVGIAELRAVIAQNDGQILHGLTALNAGLLAMMSRADAQYDNLMAALADEASDGPRLFSIAPVDPTFFERPDWLAENFELTLWCEHTRQPLYLVETDESVDSAPKNRRGVYRLSIAREWYVKAAPWLKGLSTVLGLVVPVAAAAGKLALDDATFKGIENQLGLGEKALDSVLRTGEKASPYLDRSDAKGLAGEHGEPIYAQREVFRTLQEMLRAKDKSFAGMAKVLDKQGKFHWVHPKFAGLYEDVRPTILGESPNAPIDANVAAAEWEAAEGVNEA